MSAAPILQERPLLGEPPAWTFPHFERADLAGGLTLWYRHLPGQGLVSAALSLDAPITAEPPDLAGIARITAEALTQGTRRHHVYDFAIALDRAAVHVNVSVGPDATRVSMSAPAPRMRDALGLLAEAVAEPAFPAREVARLVQQRIDGIRRDYADPPTRAALGFRAAVTESSDRLHLPDGGTAETVERIGRDDVQRFHEEHLAERCATLVVAGDLTGLDIVATVEASFDGWPGKGAKRRSPVPLEPSRGPRLIVIDRPHAPQTALFIGAPGPDRHAAAWADLRVALHALGGSLTARLDAVLREQKGYTYGVRAGAHPLRRGGFVCVAQGAIHTEVTEPAVRDALAIVGTLADGGLLDDERQAAIDYLAGVQPLQLETAAALASTVATNLEHDLAADHTAREIEALQSVTAENASAAALQHLSTDETVIVAVGDAARISADLKSIGHAPLEAIEDRA